ncbi:MAG TPA: hypothetical protein VHO25_17975 [Polyangiaceae bacterium]|nr:hypothetical protein [Polyangiaceae bacterium]
MAAVPVPKIPPAPRTVSGTRPAQRSPEHDLPPTLRDGASLPTPDLPRIEIELLIHSDQPNPHWILDQRSAETLLAQLPEESSLMPTSLEGYGGFSIRIDSAGHQRMVEVFHNTPLERWLLNSGLFYLTTEVAKRVEEHLI